MKKRKIAVTLLPVFWPNLPPLGLAYLKGFLGKNGINADAIDFNNIFFNEMDPEFKKEWLISCNKYFEDTIVRLLEKNHAPSFRAMMNRLSQYDVIGFSCFRSNFKTTRQIASKLKVINPKIRIIFGGPEIARQYFQLGNDLPRVFEGLADFFVVGEGELALFTYLTEEESTKKIARFWEMENLDAVTPDYGYADLAKYPKKKSMPLLYTRGCVKNCRFCSERLLYKTFRQGAVDPLLEEIKEHKKNGIEYFIFHDSSINSNPPGLESLCDKIIEHFGSMQWEAQIMIRPDMPERLFRKMKESGCYHLFVGLESGSDRTLNAMRKGFTANDAVEFFKKLKRFGLSFGVSIIVGFPTETHDDFMESVNFLIEHKALIPKIEQVNPFTYYDGTDLPPESDYRFRKELVLRTRYLVERIKEAGLKHTNAFICNLVER